MMIAISRDAIDFLLKKLMTNAPIGAPKITTGMETSQYSNASVWNEFVTDVCRKKPIMALEAIKITDVGVATFSDRPYFKTT